MDRPNVFGMLQFPGVLGYSHAYLEGQLHNSRILGAAQQQAWFKATSSYLVIVRLQLGFGEVGLAQRFKVSQSTVSRTI